MEIEYNRLKILNGKIANLTAILTKNTLEYFE